MARRGIPRLDRRDPRRNRAGIRSIENTYNPVATRGSGAGWSLRGDCRVSATPRPRLAFLTNLSFSVPTPPRYGGSRASTIVVSHVPALESKRLMFTGQLPSRSCLTPRLVDVIPAGTSAGRGVISAGGAGSGATRSSRAPISGEIRPPVLRGPRRLRGQGLRVRPVLPGRGPKASEIEGRSRLTKGGLSAETGACSGYPPLLAEELKIRCTLTARGDHEGRST